MIINKCFILSFNATAKICSRIHPYSVLPQKLYSCWNYLNVRATAPFATYLASKQLYTQRNFCWGGRETGLTAKYCCYSEAGHGILYRDTSRQPQKLPSELNCFYFHPTCRSETKDSVSSSFSVVRDFVNEDEEEILMKEMEPHLKRLKYEFDHWDDAIHGYREIERSRWSKAASSILMRKRLLAFSGNEESQLPQIHVLDLAQNGLIKPHVDSVRFCGDIICGLCLLSDAVMRLVHVDHRDQVVDVLLQRRSLYIMKNASRYSYTHEVLGEEDSFFGSQAVPRGRRVSIISRNHPREGDDAKSSS